MKASGATAYLVNTGWNGTGKSPSRTPGIIDAILDGSIDRAETSFIPVFNLEIPKALPNVDTNILDPRNTYPCSCEWDRKARDLAEKFVKNFAKFTGNPAGAALVSAGPKV